MKFNPFHFWTKDYEIDLLAPFVEIVKDIKRMRRIKQNKKTKISTSLEVGNMTDNEIIKDSQSESNTSSEKIKAIYPHITVSGAADKPYYNIDWYDIEKQGMYRGYSSYNLQFVRKWLQENFEVVDDDIDNLINSQQAEINKLKRQINRLKKYDEERDMALHSKLILETEVKTVKEFVEKMKNNKKAVVETIFEPQNILNYKTTYVVLVSDIEKIEKEMITGNVENA